MTQQAPDDSFNIPLAWIGVEEERICPVNQFLIQVDNDGQGIFLVAGAASPPPIMGTPEEQMAALREIPFIPARPAARLFMTRARFEELRGAMNEMAKMWEGEQA